jgi:hypothetical protein
MYIIQNTIMSQFIHITELNSGKKDSVKHILCVNTNIITAFSHMTSSDNSTNNCLLVSLDKASLNKFAGKDMPCEFIVCEKTNRRAYTDLMACWLGDVEAAYLTNTKSVTK